MGYQPPTNHQIFWNGSALNTMGWNTGTDGVCVTNIDGWFDAPDVRDTREVSAGRDGELADNLFLGGRSITIEGLVSGSSYTDLQARKRTLAALMQPRSAESTLKLPVPDAWSGSAYSSIIGRIGTTSWWRMGDAGIASDGGYDTLVASYTPLGYWRGDETSGTTAIDSSGNSRSGTYFNGPVLGGAGPIEGITNYAPAYTRASSQYVQVAYNAALNPATFTVSGWIYRAADTGTSENIFDQRVSNKGVRVLINSSDQLTLSLGDGTAYSDTVSTSTIAIGVWYHFVVTYDGTTAKIYLNGVLEASASDVYTANTSNALRIGTSVDSQNYWGGRISRVFITSTVLTAQQVTNLYLAALPSLKASDNTSTNNGLRVGSVTVGSDGALYNDANTSMTFNGTTGYISVPYVAALNAATFSITGWVRRNSDTGAAEYICDTRSGNNGYRLLVNASDKLELALGDGTGVSSNAGATSLAVNAWYHVAATYDGTTARVYLNGVLDGSGADAFAANTSSPLIIGRSATAASNYWNGRIDELAYHSTVLTQTDITRLYTSGASGYADELPNYERVDARVVEGVQFGDNEGPLLQPFAVTLKASDPRIYSDTETTATATGATIAQTVSTTNPGTYPSPCTVLYQNTTTASSGLTVGNSVSGEQLAIKPTLSISNGDEIYFDTKTRASTYDPADPAAYRLNTLAPIAYWKLDETGAAVTAANYANPGTYSGTYVGSPTLGTTGSIGTRMDLDGVNDEMTVAYAAGIVLNIFTLEMFVSVSSSLATGVETAVIDYSNGGSTGWYLTVTYTAPSDSRVMTWRLYVNNSLTCTLVRSDRVGLGAFREKHLYITRNGSNWNLGGVTGTKACTNISSGTIRFGRRSSSYFLGSLDNIVLYDKVLPDATLSQLSNPAANLPAISAAPYTDFANNTWMQIQPGAQEITATKSTSTTSTTTVKYRAARI